MRSVVACGIGMALLVVGAAGKSSDKKESLTVLFQFEGPYAERTLSEMQRELGSILKNSLIRVEWRERAGVKDTEWFPDLVVVKFKGRCRMWPASEAPLEAGPLAITHSTDGTVLSFSEVECDRVRSTMRTAMWGSDYGRSDILLGRALARVLAHELYHILAGTKSHAERGIAQPALSGSKLIGDRLEFGEAELEQMHSAAAAEQSAECYDNKEPICPSTKSSSSR